MDRDYTYKVLGCVYEVYKQLGPGLIYPVINSHFIKSKELRNNGKIPIFPDSLE